jgi:hypothetical protein
MRKRLALRLSRHFLQIAAIWFRVCVPDSPCAKIPSIISLPKVNKPVALMTSTIDVNFGRSYAISFVAQDNN